jgi:hypothetical protein
MWRIRHEEQCTDYCEGYKENAYVHVDESLRVGREPDCPSGTVGAGNPE